jgi:hypothetical protein
LRLTLPGEGFSAYVAEGCFHRIGLRAGRRPIRPGLAVAAALLTLTRTTRLALALTATRAAGPAGATRAPSSATAAVLSHWRRLQIIGFRRLAGLSVEQLRLHGRA